MERELDKIARGTLDARERDWKECQTASPLGLICPPWKIETECKAVVAGKVLSMVCVNRLTDSPDVRPNVDYNAANAIKCSNSIRIVDFEKDLCPSWRCLNELHRALIDKGLRGRPLGAESSRVVVKKIAEHFLLADDHIVFLLGQLSLDNLDYDNRFVVGYNVIALPYADFVKVAPGALGLLRATDLAPKDNGGPHGVSPR